MYILLENPPYYPRAIFGFGVFIALISLNTVSLRGWKTLGCIGALNWCFFVFSFSYGNALADQKRYADFRAGLVMEDLNVLFPDEKENLTIRTKNEIGYGPVTENIARRTPLIKRLVPSFWNGADYLANYYNWRTLNAADDDPGAELPVIHECRYHIIRSAGKSILVEFKD
jgi:hypothetical protein